MKMKKFISLLVILCVATAMLTACGKFSEERTRSVSFPKTAHATYQGTETITNYIRYDVLRLLVYLLSLLGLIQ